jgi:hypothetical protein
VDEVAKASGSRNVKHQAITLVKFMALAKRLRRPKFQVVGVLESIWLFCQHNARDGVLSKFSPLEIVGWMEFDGDAEELIDALVETRWLDRDDAGRLTVHDWHEHRPNWLKAIESPRHPRLRKAKPGSVPGKEPSVEPGSVPGKEPSAEPPSLEPVTYNPPLLSEWAEVEEVLISLPMAEARAAITEAQRHGLTPAHVLALVQHWRSKPGAWGIGALRMRIGIGLPGQSPDVLWPEPATRNGSSGGRRPAPKTERLTAEQLAERREFWASRGNGVDRATA